MFSFSYSQNIFYFSYESHELFRGISLITNLWHFAYIFLLLSTIIVLCSENRLTIFNSLQCIDFYVMAQKMFYLGKCSKSFMEFVCLLLFVGGFIHVNQVNISLMLIVCLLVLWISDRGVLLWPTLIADFSFLLFSSIRFCFVHFEALWRLLCLFPQYTVLVLVIFKRQDRWSGIHNS